MKRNNITNGFKFTDYQEQMAHDKAKLKDLLIKGGIMEVVATANAITSVNDHYLTKYGVLKSNEQKIDSMCGALPNAKDYCHQESLADKQDKMKAFILSFEPDQEKACKVLRNEFDRVNKEGGNVVRHVGIMKEIMNHANQSSQEEPLDVFLFTFYRDKDRYVRLINTLKNVMRLFVEHYTMTRMVQDEEQ
jgi:hypothetical protein